MRRELSIIVPIFNERKSLPSLLAALRRLKLRKEVILVDDGSTDGSREYLLSKKKSEILLLGAHGGKGTALRAGAGAASGRYLAFLDGDLEYSPGDIPRLVREARRRGGAVFGSRYRSVYAHQKNSYYFGNQALNFLLRRLYRTNLSDLETGLKLVPRDVFRKLRLRAKSFDIDPEITAALLLSGCPISEVPVRYRPRGRAGGKKIRWRDGFWALLVLIRARLA